MILKRMNVMVHEQGELINQIDENMKKGTILFLCVRNLEYDQRQVIAAKEGVEVIRQRIV